MTLLLYVHTHTHKHTRRYANGHTSMYMRITSEVPNASTICFCFLCCVVRAGELCGCEWPSRQLPPQKASEDLVSGVEYWVPKEQTVQFDFPCLDEGFWKTVFPFPRKYADAMAAVPFSQVVPLGQRIRPSVSELRMGPGAHPTWPGWPLNTGVWTWRGKLSSPLGSVRSLELWERHSCRTLWYLSRV